MRILIVTDAWEPQVNGVVRTLQATIGELRGAGHEIGVISPDLFRSIPCPSYAEIRLAFAGRRAVGRRIRAFAPQAIHISTEGPLGLAARRWCLDMLIGQAALAFELFFGATPPEDRKSTRLNSSH